MQMAEVESLRCLRPLSAALEEPDRDECVWKRAEEKVEERDEEEVIEALRIHYNGEMHLDTVSQF